MVGSNTEKKEDISKEMKPKFYINLLSFTSLTSSMLL